MSWEDLVTIVHCLEGFIALNDIHVVVLPAQKEMVILVSRTKNILLLLYADACEVHWIVKAMSNVVFRAHFLGARFRVSRRRRNRTKFSGYTRKKKDRWTLICLANLVWYITSSVCVTTNTHFIQHWNCFVLHREIVLVQAGKCSATTVVDTLFLLQIMK